MEKRTAATGVKLCLRQDCQDHAGDPTWLHPAPRPRRRSVYAAASRLAS